MTGRPKGAAPSPSVSVVIPTYNRARSLSTLLRALEAQTLAAEEFEVIVVDDCSSDDTATVLGRAADRSAYRLFALATERNTGGPAAPRNLGWRAASAPVIAFIDDDCAPRPGWLEAGLAAIRADPAIGVLQGRTTAPPGTNVRTVDRWAIWREVDGPTPWFECANIFYRRRALEEVGGFDEDLVTWAEDSDLGWKVVEAGWAHSFTPDAVVVHEVSVRGWGHAARFAWKDSQRVEVGARHPQMRAGYWAPWAIDRHGFEFVVALLGVALSLRWKPALALAAPYALHARPSMRRRGRIKTGAQTVIVDAIRLAGRLRGSIRARTFVI